MSRAAVDAGGRAFPRDSKWNLDGSFLQKGSPGMSLRDWFAGHASEADIEEHRDFKVCPETSMITSCRTREAAKYAYADAMIAARKGGGES